LTHLETGTTKNVDVEIVPEDTDVLVFDAGTFVRVVGRSEIFTKVEGLLLVERSLLNILRFSAGAAAGIFSATFVVVDDCALGQLTGEFMKGILSSFDVHATLSG
jgi:hypothetical protein